MIPAIIVLVALFLVLSTRPRLNSFQGQVMGTTFNVSYVATLFSHPVKDVSAVVQDALADVDQRMSTYKPDSELMKFNRAPVGEPFKLSGDIVQLVQQAREISDLSDGAYDITVGPLVNLWGFGPTQWVAVNDSQDDSDSHPLANAPEFVKWIEDQYPGHIPEATAIQEALANVGYQSLKADPEGSTLTREKALFVDLSSIAKGYGVDQAAAALRAQGIEDFMVEVGGEVLVHGVKPNGNPWRLAVIGPEMGKNGVSALVEPLDKALATSGDYLNFFEVDGKRYSHTINPVTGWPEAKRVAEVAVIADTSARADALATMFMVLGDEKGLELANRLGIAARFAYYTDEGFATVTSEAFKPYLVQQP
ncbi:FAD:protein FMN transferase [Thalassotalea sp. G20_0]|uniref:FAD:protein FMN transferase n=1 Tax=Thalassotalea sp. G20_0 TaxID=2821093 RepID=UPI001ADB0025|nr:FAD:protein FMN transferase [Thalassotalea sp. G20_0]MBO9496688.1 FAD:protein FMN transferase [Thalassotalea sp. G20_0]